MLICAKSSSRSSLWPRAWLKQAAEFPHLPLQGRAVLGLIRKTAHDLGQHRIRMNTLAPDWTMTERRKGLWTTPEALDKYRTRQCLLDLIDPVYVTPMAVFLASDDAAMYTASHFMVEAGSI